MAAAGPPRQYFVSGGTGSAPPETVTASPRPGPPPRREKPPGPNRANAMPRSGSRLRRAARPKLRWFGLYLPILIVVLLVGIAMWAWVTVNGLHRVELGDAITPATGSAVNYLIVGSDSRDGITATTPNAGAIGPGVAGRRSDTIIVLRVDDSSAKMMSIPRDLWVTNAATGKEGRINAAYGAGPDNLVRTVTRNLGIEINHYLEIDFVSFSSMVEAMGGVTIDFPHPAHDDRSGLNVTATGPVRLDGTEALAYVRSRQYTEVVDGRDVVDTTSDLGRQQRQQTFIRTVLGAMGETRSPVTALRLVDAATDGVRVDTELGLGDMWGLARDLVSAQPASVVLPTTPTTKGRASVLILSTPEAQPILAQFSSN